MAAYSKVILSGSTNGLGIKVVPTSTAGTTLHTADASAIDELWLYAVNSDTSDRKLTIEFGGVATPDNLIEFTVPAEAGLYLISPGLPITNSLVTRAFCATANVVMIYGWVNRIT